MYFFCESGGGAFRETSYMGRTVVYVVVAETRVEEVLWQTKLPALSHRDIKQKEHSETSQP